MGQTNDLLKLSACNQAFCQNPMLRTITFTILLTFFTCLCAASKPTESSIRELLEITKSRRLVDSMVIQMDAIMKDAIAQTAKGQQSSVELNTVIDRMQQKLMDALKEELDWSVLEPIYISVYQDHFTQVEVDGMLAFYRTSIGATVVDKLPVVMQQSMEMMQKRMGPLLQKLDVIQKDTIREIKNLASKKG